jgi:signal peptidase I
VQLSKNANRALTYVLVILVIVTGAELVMGSALGSSPVYVVVSKSMVPTLQVGDLVIAEKVPFSSIHAGQVIIYVPPNEFGGCSGETIVHRVVNVTSSGLITQGDDRTTNPHPDEPYQWPPVTPECVKGAVVLAIPYLGLVSMLIPFPWNYAMVGLILLFVFLSELRPSREGEEGRAGEGPARLVRLWRHRFRVAVLLRLQEELREPHAYDYRRDSEGQPDGDEYVREVRPGAGDPRATPRE